VRCSLSSLSGALGRQVLLVAAERGHTPMVALLVAELSGKTHRVDPKIRKLTQRFDCKSLQEPSELAQILGQPCEFQV
jgi:hypothetical protein